MRGNVYISLNSATYKSKIPNELVERYGYSETNEEGNTTEVHPTWEQVGERNKSTYGAVVKIKVGTRNLYVMEITASWLAHEMSAVLALGNGLDAPQNTVMTAEEASELINLNTDTDV